MCTTLKRSKQGEHYVEGVISALSSITLWHLDSLDGLVD